jgi:hypothetical protein
MDDNPMAKLVCPSKECSKAFSPKKLALKHVKLVHMAASPQELSPQRKRRIRPSASPPNTKKQHRLSPPVTSSGKDFMPSLALLTGYNDSSDDNEQDEQNRSGKPAATHDDVSKSVPQSAVHNKEKFLVHIKEKSAVHNMEKSVVHDKDAKLQRLLSRLPPPPPTMRTSPHVHRTSPAINMAVHNKYA